MHLGYTRDGVKKVVRYVLVVFHRDKLPSFHTFDSHSEAHAYRTKHYPLAPNHISSCYNWPHINGRGKHEVSRFYLKNGMDYELYITVFPVEMSE